MSASANPRPCFKFSGGKCTYGTRCRYSHSNTPNPSTPARNNNSRRPYTPSSSFAHSGSSPSSPFSPSRTKAPCTYYLERNRCGYGDNCKFSHEPAGPSTTTTSPENPAIYAAARTFIRWKRLLGREGFFTSLRPELGQLELVLKDGVKIVTDGSADTRQGLIKELGSESGLGLLKVVLEAEFDLGLGSSVTFAEHCVPLLELVSHEEVCASLTMEKTVRTIYSFIYGVDGVRGIGFFRSVVQQLKRISVDLDTEDPKESRSWFHAALSATAKTLFHTVNLNRAAVVQDEFKQIVKDLCGCYSPTAAEKDFTLRGLHDDIQKIKEQLAMRDLAPLYSGKIKTVNEFIEATGRRGVEHPAPPLLTDADFPGHLSEEGPRHDNDHPSIRDIKILPTTSEIKSHRREFLPKQTPGSPHHLEGIARILDSQFRLLREDTSGPLRDAVRTLHENWNVLVEGNDRVAKRKVQGKAGTRMLIYESVHIERARFDRTKGLVLDISFQQPAAVAGLSAPEREGWWNTSKWLQTGALLGLVDASQKTTFLVVSQRTVIARIPTMEMMGERDYVPPLLGGVQDLAGNRERAVVTMQLADPGSKADQDTIVALFDSQRNGNLPTGTTNGTGKLVLVEFLGVLFVSFEPILKCLQSLDGTCNLPFIKYIIPSPSPPPITRLGGIFAGTTAKGPTNISPPLYMLKSGINLDLSSITHDKKTPLKYSIANPVSLEELEENTTLDGGQCEAVAAALGNELALIQGPPGTGKSYVGNMIVRVLLKNKKLTRIGPVVCVCYTNHALDQFLEQLLDDGTEKIVRLGSCSKIEKLQNLTLQKYCEGTERTRAEKSSIWEAYSSIDKLGKEMKEVCEKLQVLNTWKGLTNHLKEHHLAHYNALFGKNSDDEDPDWSTVRNRKQDNSRVINRWLIGQSPTGHESNSQLQLLPKTDRPVESLIDSNIWRMSISERQRLKEYWEKEVRLFIEKDLEGGVKSHISLRHDLNQQYREHQKRVCEEADVIGVTTTGLASNSELLRSLNSAKVLICEEAGEVLEAHVLTALLPSIQHAIFIGDHLQLRPHISNYDLSVESAQGKAHRLDVSLFERLAIDNLPVAKLSTQRRMHPSISSLVRNTLYPELTDHPITSHYPQVNGMRKRLFWLDHRNLEDSAMNAEPTQTSKTNTWEADMVIALVRHLNRQGSYGLGDIAVLTPYLGQFMVLRKKLGDIFELVVGDKDQEEIELESAAEALLEAGGGGGRGGAKVKSKMKSKTGEVQKGKLSEAVRLATVDNFQGEEAEVVIVSLVRSNEDRACGFLKTPNRINVLLSRAKHGMYIIGNAETSGSVKMWADVIGMLEAGNNISQELELHCPRHPTDRMCVSQPKDFIIHAPEGGCSATCGLRLGCGHTCINKCHSDMLHGAVKCLEPCVRQGFTYCDHSCPKRCWQDCGECMVKIPKVELPCGHIAPSVSCQELQNLAAVKCRKRVTRVLPVCEHEVTLECHIDVEGKGYYCPKTCGDILSCGDECKKPCHSCKRKNTEGIKVVDHGKCISLCGRSFTTCNHECVQSCHGKEPCAPCKLPCEVRCTHSRCSKLCSEPCPPCAKYCTWSCIHRSCCDLPCSVPCDLLPCDKRCEEVLSCKHRCPGVCGETCPSKEFCQICASPKILQRRVDFITRENFSEIDVDQDPVVFLTCGHFYTISSLDKTMELDKLYLRNQDGEFTGTVARVSTGGFPKGCPECRKPLRDIHRYNRVVKPALLDESVRRFTSKANDSFLELLAKVEAEEKKIEADRAGSHIVQKLQVYGVDKLGRNSEPSAKQLIAKHWNKSSAITREIKGFITSAQLSEKPFQKVQSMVIDAKRSRDATSTTSVFEESAIWTGVEYRGISLLMRVCWAMLWDLHKVFEVGIDEKDGYIMKTLSNTILARLEKLLDGADDLLGVAVDKGLAGREIEARVYHALFLAVRLRYLPPCSPSPTPARLPEAEAESLDRCKQLIAAQPSSTLIYLQDDVEKARQLLAATVGGERMVYRFASSREKRHFYKAMAEQPITGNSYYCQNWHPFTVRGRGLLLVQQARCPECGAEVKGLNHQTTEGVKHAADMNEMFGRMRVW